MGAYEEVINKLTSNGLTYEAAVHYCVQTFGVSILDGLLKEAKDNDRVFVSISDIQSYIDELNKSNELILKKRK